MLFNSLADVRGHTCNIDLTTQTEQHGAGCLGGWCRVQRIRLLAEQWTGMFSSHGAWLVVVCALQPPATGSGRFSTMSPQMGQQQTGRKWMWTSCMPPQKHELYPLMVNESGSLAGWNASSTAGASNHARKRARSRADERSARRMQLHGLVGTLARLGITSDLCGPHNLHQQGAGLRVTPAKTWLPRTAGRQPPIASSRLTYGSLTMSE